MSWRGKNFVAFKMEGSEEYSSQVKDHYKLIDSVSPLVLNLLDKVKPFQGQPFVIGDFGSADGGTSYVLLRKAIAHLRRKHGDEMPIQLVYVDQPINDFKPNFLRAQGLIEGTSGLTAEFQNVYVLASGCSFYSQCLPKKSLDIIVCFTSVHWLSKSPRVPCSSLFPTITKGDVFNAFKEQAASDWEKFLLMRAKELKPGGYLVVTDVSCTSDDWRTTTTEDFLARVSDVWRNLFDDGVISKVEFERTEMAFHCRTPEELEKPFKDPESPVIESGLVLVSLETVMVPRVFREQCSELAERHPNGSSTVGDLAKAIVASHRPWIEGGLYQGLSEHRSEEDKAQILDTFFASFRDQVARDPLGYNPDIPQSCMVMKKESKLEEDVDVPQRKSILNPHV